MVMKRREWPKVGELVIGTVVKVFDQGAYITLDEYNNKEAYVPAGEITRSWFHDIREFVKEGRKQVFKVIRVNPRRGHIDVSLRRVSDSERRYKIYEWKRAQRAEKLLEMAAEKLGKSLKDAYKEAGWRLEDFFGEIYAALEVAADKGETPLLEAGLDKKWAAVLTELAKEYVEIPKTKLTAILTLVCYKPNGINAIKKALLKAVEFLKTHNEIEWRIYTIGAPRYRVEIVTKNPKEGEKILRKACELVVKTITKLGGKGTFQREGR